MRQIGFPAGVAPGGGGGGTSNYNDLINKPSINGQTLVGDLQITVASEAQIDALWND